MSEFLWNGWTFDLVNTLAVFAVLYFALGIDDFLVDLSSIFMGARPKTMSGTQFDTMMALPEKKLAVMIPAWDEGELIGQMVQGNIPRIVYKNYHIFLGVYPNDPDTVNCARKLHERFPNVHPVINSQEGPSSKGQMLNEVIEYVKAYEKEAGIEFDAFHMQDSEDIIHPYALKLVNQELETSDFVQIPVFSLATKQSQIVAGTYMDEFAESHTKDIIVRSRLKAAVPSAGVGTTFSKRAVNRVQLLYGDVFNDKSVTEDYELGLLVNRCLLKSTFSSWAYRDPKTGKREIIATREYFPQKFARSIRQKTRWTVGITLQGWRNTGWFGNLANRFFLYRDRKGVFANVINLLGLTVAVISAFSVALETEAMLNTLAYYRDFAWLLAANLFFMFNRALWRMVCASRVYGWTALFMAPIRIPVSNIINAIACIRAIKQFVSSVIFETQIAWSKTSHTLPIGFGEPPESEPADAK